MTVHDTTSTKHFEPTGPAITCYGCGSRYAFLGSGHHGGQCPDCGSRAVSPAGDLQFAKSEDVTDESKADTGDRVIHVVATDETDRHFDWWVVTGGEEAMVVRVLVDDEPVPLLEATGSQVLPLQTLAVWIESHLEGATLRAYRAGVGHGA
ncbi:hypothetical protein [Haloferax sulfurifontis]|uniref:Uncharacterized protein n=2 Tax=Haloferax sulfurifontis TaxID=255616 RepID=M0IIJ8_9EURY|nr:hypothetical protein [Haloferax sulfurifontis]ELZ96606.1 hypothetical protein C441_04539 [Haloferax sulfurifontis ATCC BAA-897]GGC72525.1 hypothetical protein GCM10007209_38080 [Haloferax sulfurifontis]